MLGRPAGPSYLLGWYVGRLVGSKLSRLVGFSWLVWWVGWMVVGLF